MTAGRLGVEFCGEWSHVESDATLGIGRDADLHVDDNPYLHRRFLRVYSADGFWWLRNEGTRLSATVSGVAGGVRAQLQPGGCLPLVFGSVTVVFTAGPTTYELAVHAPPAVAPVEATRHPSGETTLGAPSLTPTQRALVVALAEPLLRLDGTGAGSIPTSAQAAARLGWPLTKFNRKLDNVCDKLHRTGVAGLRGTTDKLASHRRVRLVEHAVSSRLVSREDLVLLDAVPVAGTGA